MTDLKQRIEEILDEYAAGNKTTEYHVNQFVQLIEENYIPKEEAEETLLKMGKEITKHQFEVYTPLRKIVVELPEIVAVFDRNGIDLVENVDF